MNKKEITSKLIDIVGKENISDDLADLIAYERDDQFPFVPPHPPDYVVRPQTKQEIQEILRLANKYKIPVVPFASGINRKGLCIASQGGILLDLRRMTRIKINEEMMTAIVEPGVNFAQLVTALNRYPHLRCLTPDAPATASVLANYMLRGIYATSTRYGIDHLLTMEIALPNGDILNTGSAVTPNTIGPYCNIVNGPDLTKLFQANVGTMGVVTEGCIKLYPMPEKFKFLLLTFPDFESMLQPAKTYTIRNLTAGIWIWTFTADALQTIMKLRSAAPEWFALALYLEGTLEEVQKQEESVLEIAEDSKGEQLKLPPDFEKEFILDHRYMRGDVRGWRRGNLYGCSLYGAFKNLPGYYKAGKEICQKYGFAYHFEALPVSPFHGQLTYVDPCVLWDGGDPDQITRIRALHNEMRAALLEVGIYGWFRAFPDVVNSYDLGMYGELWRKIKQLIDPNNIMNPGKPPLI